MKQRLRCQRILILSLLSFSVLAPVVFLSSRTGRFSPSFDPKREFVEDILGIKYHSDALHLNSIKQEGGEGLKEPEGEVLKDRKYIETVVVRDVSVDDVNGKDKGVAGEIVASSNSNGSSAQMVGERVIKGVSFLQNVPSAVNTPATREANGNSRHRPVTCEKISEMKDQLIMAKAYLQFSPSNSNSHLVRELKLRIKEIERVLGHANKDSDLSRSALQKIRAMKASLSKASKVYPDCHAMSIKLRAMAYNNEEQLRAQKNQASYLVQLAARTFPKGLHCLAMQLTADYFSLQPEERELSKKQRVQQAADLYHFAILSDNILASSVVVKSTVASSTDPSKIVFHIVTDTLNFPAMVMWFLTNPPRPAAVHVENMDHFGWLPSGFSSALKRPGVRDPRYTSSLNHLRFYLPQIFPYLDKVVLLDHDVVVQRDLGGLWKVDMRGKVNAAVELCRPGDSSHRLDRFVDFSDPNMAKNLSPKSCVWALGMNVLDLHKWRKRGLTRIYERWLHSATRGKSFKAGGPLPLALLTFYNQTVALHRRWHVLGLGYDPGVSRAEINRAAVIHFDGDRKPWLEIGMPKYRGYWGKFIDYDNPYLRRCNIHE